MKRITYALLGAMTLAGGSLAAHHGIGAYQQDVTVSIDGTILDMLFEDPHVMLQISASDGFDYTVTWLSASELAPTGVEASTLRPRQYVVVTGSPSVNPRAHRMSLVQEIARPEDGWRWIAGTSADGGTAN